MAGDQHLKFFTSGQHSVTHRKTLALEVDSETQTVEDSAEIQTRKKSKPRDLGRMNRIMLGANKMHEVVFKPNH